MRILHCDTGREDRGGQRQVALLIQEQLGAGHRPLLAAPPGSALARRFEGAAGVAVAPIEMRGELSLPAVLALRHLVRAERVEVLHAHTAHALTLLHLARWPGQTPPLVAHRRVDFALKTNLFARRKRRWPQAWIAVSDGVRAQLVRDGVEATLIHVVESAIDPARLVAHSTRAAVRAGLGLAESAYVIGTLGQLAAHKGHAVLIDALAALPRPHDVHLLLVGEGALERELRERAARAHLADRVHLLGFREDSADLIGALDLFAFPSLGGEGSPAALKEALVLGTPVLVSDIPAHRSLGIDPARLLPPQDVGAWSAALAGMWKARGVAPMAGAASTPGTDGPSAGDDFAERFSPSAMGRATERVYAAVLG